MAVLHNGLVADDGERQCWATAPQRARRRPAGANRPGSQRVRLFTRLGDIADLSAGARLRELAKLSPPAAAGGLPQRRRRPGAGSGRLCFPLWVERRIPPGGGVSARGRGRSTQRSPGWCGRRAAPAVLAEPSQSGEQRAGPVREDGFQCCRRRTLARLATAGRAVSQQGGHAHGQLRGRTRAGRARRVRGDPACLAGPARAGHRDADEVLRRVRVAIVEREGCGLLPIRLAVRRKDRKELLPQSPTLRRRQHEGLWAPAAFPSCNPY